MEAIFLVCGAGGPQLKRNPLGGRTNSEVYHQMVDAGAALAFTFAGALTSGMALNILVVGRRSASWPQVPGIVRRAWTPLIGRLFVGYAGPRLVYEYAVAGIVYEGSRVRYGGYLTPNQARRARYRYEVGAQMPVYYNPHDPTRAVLEPGTPGDVWAMIIIGAVMLEAGLYFGLF